MSPCVQNCAPGSGELWDRSEIFRRWRMALGDVHVVARILGQPLLWFVDRETGRVNPSRGDVRVLVDMACARGRWYAATRPPTTADDDV